jgi:hypothetical protein
VDGEAAKAGTESRILDWVRLAWTGLDGLRLGHDFHESFRFIPLRQRHYGRAGVTPNPKCVTAHKMGSVMVRYKVLQGDMSSSPERRKVRKWGHGRSFLGMAGVGCQTENFSGSPEA